MHILVGKPGDHDESCFKLTKNVNSAMTYRGTSCTVLHVFVHISTWRWINNFYSYQVAAKPQINRYEYISAGDLTLNREYTRNY